ncbi:iron-sulfur cluster co-chaperone protein HscB, mitochondrial [Quillaja saponaria]|uniref:Iron-sulfur cluster co-chaperone protein HscB, mitochondrial n=1 Tax=Quillaja saponaria TaxID=32244 RepID=A0AAD7Q6S7_QUISA|nr:iron-sulfur cluster co-chaperone protein HscB, mitochondrial [Quillaja saponaria]
MSKKKLFTPLSTFLRKIIAFVPDYSSISSTTSSSYSSQIKSSICFSLLPPTNVRLLHNLKFCNSFEYLRISGNFFFSNSSEKVEGMCWNCHAVVDSAPFLFCESCRSIQPVDKSVDYFEIFGLEKKYDIEGENLEGKYKQWQKKLHPDLVHSKSEKERDYAAEQSARVIDAFHTLSKPLSRAIYILKLEGVEVDEEQTTSEPQLLSEIMEIREAVEEAADSQALNQILSQMQGKLKEWSSSFDNAFRNQNFEEAQTCIRRMTYYDRRKLILAFIYLQNESSPSSKITCTNVSMA